MITFTYQNAFLDFFIALLKRRAYIKKIKAAILLKHISKSCYTSISTSFPSFIHTPVNNPIDTDNPMARGAWNPVKPLIGSVLEMTVNMST